jgi:hypothetical protein
MPRLTDAFALMGISLVVCEALLSVLAAWRGAGWREAWVKWLAPLCFFALWIPMGSAQIPAVAYLRGITADLSITLIALACVRICHLALGWRAVPKRDEMAIMAVLALAALFLYPTALGWGDWDAYRPGWGSWGMLLVLAGLSAVCWAQGLLVLPGLVALALLAWSVGLMESSNLWDYLSDPWLSAFALGWMCMKSARAVLRRFR